MNTVRFLGMTGGRMEKHTERLSSGYRINRGADDAAGLSISEKMRRQIRGLTQACANAQDGISLVQSAEGALHEVHDMLQRLNVLAIQSANGTNGEAERSYLQEEVAQILGEVDRIASTTSFNGRLLLDGSLGRKEGGGQSVTPYIRFFDETVYEVIADQNPSYRAFYTEEQERAWGGVKRMLEEAIVPQAVTAIVQRLGDTFSYLDGSEIGIGLILYENADSSTVASVALRTAPSTTPVLDVDVSYSLRVNMAMLYLDEANNYSLSEQTRKYRDCA